MRPKALSVAALLLIAAPNAAQAGYREWNYHCTMGAFTACASVAVWTMYDPSTETTAIRLRMANLQGAVSWLPASGSYGLVGFELQDMLVEPPSWWTDPNGVWFNENGYWANQSGSYDVEVGSGDLRALDWGEYYPRYGTDERGLSFGFYLDHLWGCDGDQGNVGMDSWMCGGYIDFVVTFDGRWDVTDGTQLQLQFALDGPGPAGYQPLTCTTGVDCVTVTPEPITLVLLGSGLAGLGGAGLMRRRRKGEVT